MIKKVETINEGTIVSYLYKPRIEIYTAYFDGGFDLHEIRLLEEDTLGNETELPYLRLRELNLFRGSIAFRAHEPVYYTIENLPVHNQGNCV